MGWIQDIRLGRQVMRNAQAMMDTRGPTIENPGIPLSTQNILEYFGWSDTDTNISIDKALEVPAVWAAVTFISSAMASLPLDVFERQEDGSKKKVDSLLEALLHDAPNPNWTKFDWIKYTQTNALTGGRGLTFIERNQGEVVGLWPLDPERTTLKEIADERGPRRVYIYRQGDKPSIEYDGRDVLDIKFMLHRDGISAVSPVRKLKRTLSLSIKLEEYALRYFANGGVPPLQMTGPINTPGAISRASDDMSKAVMRANKKNENVIAMPTGHELKQVGYNPQESQLVDARRYQLEETGRIYQISPIFLQDLTKGTFANTEQQDLHVIKHTLTQWITQWEQQLNLKLFGQTDRSTFVKFNLSAMERGDFKTRMEGLARMIQNALLTPNEGRGLEDLPEKEGGDQLVIQQNMTGLGGVPNGTTESE